MAVRPAPTAIPPDDPRPPGRTATWANRNVVAMAATSFLSDLGHEMATAVLPAFTLALGLGAGALGTIEGVADGVASFVKLGAGWLSDRREDRKSIATAGYALTGASKALFALAHGWPLILMGRTLAWFGRGIRGPVRDAMLADSVAPAYVGRAFGLHRAGDTLGAVAGPLAVLLYLASFGAHDASYRTIFVLTLVPGLASAALFGGLVTEPGERRVKKALSLTGAHLGPRFHQFLVAVGVFGVADFAPTLLILRMTDVMAVGRGASAVSLGVGFYTVRNAVYAAASYPIGALSDRMSRGALLTIGYLLMVFVALGAAVPYRALWFIMAVFVVSGLVAAAQDSLEAAMAADLLPQPLRGTGYGALAAVNGVGDLLSSVMVGVLWSAGSARLAFGVSAALAAAGTLQMLRFVRARHEEHDKAAR